MGHLTDRNATLGLRLGGTEGNNHIYLDVFDDEGRIRSGEGASLARGWRFVEMEWVAGNSAQDPGYASLWIDGQLLSEVIELRNKTAILDSVRLGVLQVFGSNVLGSMYVDDFGLYTTLKP